MNIPKCKYRRWTRRPDLVQMHCFLKRKNIKVKDCLKCKDHNLKSAMDYKGYRPTSWIVNLPSRGLGDTIAKIAHVTGISKIVKKIEKITGKPCGCPERQERLNKQFPYKG